jgi:negative regulator of sigma E activity
MQDNLSNLLHDAKASPGLPPRFQAEVWSKIAAREKTSLNWSQSLRQWIAQLTPKLALVTCLLLIVAGGVSGTISGKAQVNRNLAMAKAHYLNLVDPLHQ